MTKKFLFPLFATLFSCLSFSQTSNNWKLIFEDNFNGTSFSTNNWAYCTRMTSDWNKYLKSSTETVQVQDGNLSVKAIKNTNLAADNVPYFTGGIQSKGKFNFKYGKIEVRAKMSNGKGSWPAIWLMPEDGTGGWPACGEIDIMERLNSDAFVYQTIHSYFGNTLGITNPTKSKTASITNGEYNTYGLEWYPDRLDFTVNGAIKFTYPRITTDKQGQWPFDKPFYIILNQAAGGSWVGNITDSDLPFQMQVDYVKVYQRDSTQNYTTPTWSNTTYTYNSTHWKDEYVSSISSTGAQNNVVYSASAHPSDFVVLYPDTLVLTKNSTFNLNLIANSLGAYNESTVLQDLRYTHCTAFADFDGDKIFETVLPTIGNAPPTNGTGGNYNVMNATQTFNVPNKTLKAGRIRVVYRGAWSSNISPEISLNEGMVYDFNVKIVGQSTGIKGTSFAPAVQCKGNTVYLSGLKDKTVITLIDCTGRIISQNTSNSAEISLNIPEGFSILKMQNESGEIYTQKLMRK